MWRRGRDLRNPNFFSVGFFYFFFLVKLQQCMEWLCNGMWYGYMLWVTKINNSKIFQKDAWERLVACNQCLLMSDNCCEIVVFLYLTFAPSIPEYLRWRQHLVASPLYSHYSRDDSPLRSHWWYSHRMWRVESGILDMDQIWHVIVQTLFATHN